MYELFYPTTFIYSNTLNQILFFLHHTVEAVKFETVKLDWSGLNFVSLYSKKFGIETKESARLNMLSILLFLLVSPLKWVFPEHRAHDW
jgi:hypothetical protein